MSRRQPIAGRKIALAALLALIVLLISQPHDLLVAGHPAAAPHRTQHAHTAQVRIDRPQHGHHATQSFDCEATVTGCCAMAHCQPVLAVTNPELTRVTACAEAWVGNPVQGFGSDPKIILPPPRNVST